MIPRYKPPIPTDTLCISCGEIIIKTIFMNKVICEECENGS